MTERFSAYLSIYNDWELLGPALRSIAGKLDELVVVDGAYKWMYSFLEKVGIDPERSDARVMEAVRACGVPIKLVARPWENEIEKRITGYQACGNRYVYRIDADEILFFHDNHLAQFIEQRAPVGQMEMPIYAAPGWVVATSEHAPLDRQALLFDRNQISAEAHLHYLWLVLGKDVLPKLPHAMAPVFPWPIAFNAHLTNWRTPETSVNRASFYTLNFMRHYHAPWVPEHERVPIGDFDALFRNIDAVAFREAFRMNDTVIGQALLKSGACLRRSPIGRDADARLAPLYTRFLTSIADLNGDLTRDGRAFTLDMVITIDLSTDAATEPVVHDGTLTLAFSAELLAARVALKYLIPAPPWQIIIEPPFTRIGERLVIAIPSDGPKDYLRRSLDVQIWSPDKSVIQRVRCLRSPSDR